MRRIPTILIFAIVGVLVCSFLFYLNENSIVVDTILSEMSLDVAEVGFLLFFGSIFLGVILHLIGVKYV